jgi:signal transduction histidine kinase
VVLSGVSIEEAAPIVDELRAAGIESVCEQATEPLARLVGELPAVVVVGTGASQLAAGIAHDLRNVILFPLAMHAELAERALRAGNIERVRGVIAAMLQVVGHGEATIARLVRDSRHEIPKQRVYPHELASRALEIANAHLRRSRSRVELVLEVAAARQLEVEIADVVAAVVNVMVNAIEAMPHDGRVALQVTADDAGVWFAVRDEGPGIPQAVRDRLFEPYFTTKPGGTGLGLAMVQLCVRRHGGRIEVDTGATGTTMRLYFPFV